MIEHEPVKEVIPTQMWLLSCPKPFAILSLKVGISSIEGSMGKMGVMQLLGELVLLEWELMDLLEALDRINFAWMVGPGDP